MFQAQTETQYFTYIFFTIQLALALKTRLCVYMYLPYMCVYITTNVPTVVFMENWNLWDCGFYPPRYLRGKRNNNMSQIPDWGKVNTTVHEEHISCVYTNTHIYTDSYINTYIPIIWNIHILTHLLWTLAHYIIYSPSWKQSFPHLTQATGDCLLPNLSGISKNALILSQWNAILRSQFYFWWLLFKFSRPNPVNTFT